MLNEESYKIKEIQEEKAIKISDLLSHFEKEKQIVADGLYSVVVCPDKKTACPDGTTCCQMRSGGYGCCPLPHVSHFVPINGQWIISYNFYLLDFNHEFSIMIHDYTDALTKIPLAPAVAVRILTTCCVTK